MQKVVSLRAWRNSRPTPLAGLPPLNPGWAVRALVRYDQHLLQRVAGRDACQRWAFALAAYNAGTGTILKKKAADRAAGGDGLVWFGAADRFAVGQSPANYRQTSDYVHRILQVLDVRYAKAGWGPRGCDAGR